MIGLAALPHFLAMNPVATGLACVGCRLNRITRRAKRDSKLRKFTYSYLRLVGRSSEAGARPRNPDGGTV